MKRYVICVDASDDNGFLKNIPLVLGKRYEFASYFSNNIGMQVINEGRIVGYSAKRFKFTRSLNANIKIL